MVIIILICNHQVVGFLTFSFYFFLHSVYFLISLTDYTHPSLSRGLHEGYLVVLGSVPHLGVKIALVTHQDHRHVMSSLLTATTMRVKQTEVSSSLTTCFLQLLFLPLGNNIDNSYFVYFSLLLFRSRLYLILCILVSSYLNFLEINNKLLHTNI